ncbi:putative histidine kinase response regulator and transcription factor RR-A-type family [Helianthus annuus]|nr:putative histidine kinase response regulator and transcription factor RR-A-type family [Helianthus annuus]KAJ0900045.1 putative histidine kinase response regulator and transcription factor RR-A-type family [Helianthus annuus]
MSFIHVIGFGLKVGHFLLMLCYSLLTVISLNSFINDSSSQMKANKSRKIWNKFVEIFSRNTCKIHYYYQYIGSDKFRKTWWKRLLILWIALGTVLSLWIFWYLRSQALEKRKEILENMCDERARMLQDQFNVSMNHVQAMSILISTFHHAKKPSAIDQDTFAKYTERTAFERPLTSGVAYAVRVLHSEREQFEKQQGWTIKKMTSVNKDKYNPEDLESSPIQPEYAPVIFAQDTVAHVISLDMMTGKEDRENVLRARELGKGVLTAPLALIKSNRLGVILTFAVYKRDLPSNATPEERIEATDGYLGGVFDIESLVEKLLQQLASKQTIYVNVYDTTNISDPISMYGTDALDTGLEHVSPLNFGDPSRKHEMRCRFTQKQPWQILAISTSFGIFVITLLVGQIFHATINRIEKVEDDYHEMSELKKRAEAADVAKSEFLATVSHEIRTPMNGVLGMLDMLMDTVLDVTQQDYVRTAQASGKALVSLINAVLDQAKIESGKLELEAVQFDLREIFDDVLSLFSGKSQEKGIELAVYISAKVPETLIGDPGRFRQIITNLMGNSIKFTEKGHIFVTVHLLEEVMESIDVETEPSSKDTLSGLPVADRNRSWAGFRRASKAEGPSDSVTLIISVEDTGGGIPLDAQPRIFTPFMQVGPSIYRMHGGTGIGLSISKCLVNLMNGEIGFDSIPQIGSTFTFTAEFSNPNEQQINGQSQSKSEFCNMQAVVVDPRPVRAEVSKYHIQRLGMHVEIVSSLTNVLSMLTNGSQTIRVVLIEEEVWNQDLSNSAVFMYKLKNLDHKIPPKLFLLTNSIGGSRQKNGISSPTVITKPLRVSMLAASLQRAMGGNKSNDRNGEIPKLSLSKLLAGRKILVVDDNNVNLRVAAGALKKYGAEVVCAENGRKAISLLTPPHLFDACFMDIQMPEMDGFEATRTIRKIENDVTNDIQNGSLPLQDYANISNWHVPILAMTADVIQATHEQCIRSGMDGYVSKPFEANQLYQEVSRFFL